MPCIITPCPTLHCLVSFLKASLTRPSRARIPQPQHGQRAPAGGATLTDAGASRARLPQASLLTITRKQVCLPTRLAAHSVSHGGSVRIPARTPPASLGEPHTLGGSGAVSKSRYASIPVGSLAMVWSEPVIPGKKMQTYKCSAIEPSRDTT